MVVRSQAQESPLQGLPVSQRLNPPLDTTSTDPFHGTGWGHKKYLQPKESGAYKAGLGKRTQAVPSDAAMLLSSSLPALECQLAAPTTSTRFTRGLHRKRVPPIRPQSPGELTRCEQKTRQTERNRAARSARLTAHSVRSGCNILTGGPPAFGEAADEPVSRPKIKPKHVIDRELASPDNEGRAARRLRATAMRMERLRLDGQPACRKEWGVGEQLHSMDGFIMPKDVERVFALPPYKAGRRPIPRPPDVNNVVI
ncbi:hypothetical protein DIPPA_19417 [Diplonema papillatum]|nr:hypothetical protein DIPPA_19417 [Diplonema papillatum]